MSAAAANPKKTGQIPKWIVTFADLMALLMCFFVLLLASSVPDVPKMQAVAGSMRDTFGVQVTPRKTGVIELDGNPMRADHKLLRETVVEEMQMVQRVAPNESNQQNDGAYSPQDIQFAAMAATLRQALQAMPDISDLSRHIVIEQNPDGLDIQLMDQDGRAMFDEGSSQPREHVEAILAAIAPVIRSAPNRLRLSGHTAAGSEGGKTGNEWALSSARADAVRAILTNNGIPATRFGAIQGFGSTEPMFLDNPFLVANRRVTISLLHEAPPLPSSGLLGR